METKASMYVANKTCNKTLTSSHTETVSLFMYVALISTHSAYGATVMGIEAQNELLFKGLANAEISGIQYQPGFTSFICKRHSDIIILRGPLTGPHRCE